MRCLKLKKTTHHIIRQPEQGGGYAAWPGNYGTQVEERNSLVAIEEQVVRPKKTKKGVAPIDLDSDEEEVRSNSVWQSLYYSMAIGLIILMNCLFQLLGFTKRNMNSIAFSVLSILFHTALIKPTKNNIEKVARTGLHIRALSLLSVVKRLPGKLQNNRNAIVTYLFLVTIVGLFFDSPATFANTRVGFGFYNLIEQFFKLYLNDEKAAAYLTVALTTITDNAAIYGGIYFFQRMGSKCHEKMKRRQNRVLDLNLERRSQKIDFCA